MALVYSAEITSGEPGMLGKSDKSEIGLGQQKQKRFYIYSV